jgi:hypothetical protein
MNEHKHLIKALDLPAKSELSVRLNSHIYLVKVTDTYQYQVAKDDMMVTTNDKRIALASLKYYLKEDK